MDTNSFFPFGPSSTWTLGFDDGSVEEFDITHLQAWGLADPFGNPEEWLTDFGPPELICELILNCMIHSAEGWTVEMLRETIETCKRANAEIAKGRSPDMVLAEMNIPVDFEMES